jgi:hypothetical protein
MVVVDGMAGFRGRIRLADMPLFLPYYFDIGTGGSPSGPEPLHERKELA